MESHNKKLIEKLNGYWLKFQKLSGIKVLKENIFYFMAAFLGGLYFYIAGMLFEGLAGHSIWLATPLTLFKALYFKWVHSKTLQPDFYRFFAISLLSPFFYGYAIYQSYRHTGLHGLKIILGVTIGLLGWIFLADTLFQFSLTHQFFIGDPFHFLRYLWLEENPAIQKKMGMAAFIGGLPVLLLMIALIGRNYLPNIYGRARFASFFDIQKAGLFKEEGVYLGKTYGKKLFLGGFEHVILFAPTGSGKTESEAIPNLFYWQGSLVCTDLKLTLFKLTAGYRQSIGHQIFLFNPIDERGSTHRYNPLSFISKDAIQRIEEVQRIAYVFIPHDHNSKNPFWDNQARLLLTGLIHYVLDHEEHDKTFGEINRIIKSTPNFNKYLRRVLKEENLHYIARNCFYSFLDSPEQTHQNIRDTLVSYLGLFDNPLIEAATSSSDFDLRELRKNKMTIYVGVPENAMDRLAPLLSVFYEQLAKMMTAYIPDESEPYGVLLLLDEFGSLRKMESFKAITLFRQYRLRVFIILQELAQLYEVYGRNMAKIFLNTKARIFYTQIDMETSKYVEASLGNKTIEITNQNRRLNVDFLSQDGLSENTHYLARPLMLAQEIQQMPRNKAVILLEGQPPIYADKVQWHKDKKLEPLVKPAPHVPSTLSTARAIFEKAQNKHKIDLEDSEEIQDFLEIGEEKAKNKPQFEIDLDVEV